MCDNRYEIVTDRRYVAVIEEQMEKGIMTPWFPADG